MRSSNRSAGWLLLALPGDPAAGVPDELTGHFKE